MEAMPSDPITQFKILIGLLVLLIVLLSIVPWNPTPSEVHPRIETSRDEPCVMYNIYYYGAWKGELVCGESRKR